MGIFGWFDTREGDELVQAIVNELVKRVPPATLPAKDKKAALRLRNTHDAVFARAGKYARTHKLNVYKKARFGNRVKWALREAKYPPQFVDIMTHKLVEQAALASSKVPRA